MGFWDFWSGTTPAGIISETGEKIVTSVFTGVNELIKTFHLPPAEELKAQLTLQQLELDAKKAQLQDVQSARSMQMATHSVWPGILTAIVVTGFFVVLGLVISVGLPKVNEDGAQAIYILIGSLVSGYTMVLAFWFGTTQGSQNKDQMIWKSVPANQIPQLPQTPQTVGR